MLRPALIALQFLTRLPVRLTQAPEPVELGRSLLWYPAVGLLLGLLLFGFDAMLGNFTPPLLRAALLLAAWVLLTGALHLDGLADSADAWMGGGGIRERILSIMKDTHVGAGAISALVTVLLLKVAAIDALPATQRLALLLPPILSRTAMTALFAWTPYVRNEGIASAHADQVPRPAALIVLVVVIALVLATFRLTGAMALTAGLVCFLALRASMLRRLGGTTGDTAGAMIELIETTVLIATALFLNAAAT